MWYCTYSKIVTVSLSISVLNCSRYCIFTYIHNHNSNNIMVITIIIITIIIFIIIIMMATATMSMPSATSAVSFILIFLDKVTCRCGLKIVKLFQKYIMPSSLYSIKVLNLSESRLRWWGQMLTIFNIFCGLLIVDQNC